LPAAQQALQASQQNRQFKWFGKIIVSPRGEALEHILRVAARGQHQDGDEILAGPQFRSDRKTILAGKHHVEDNRVEIAVAEKLQSALAIRRYIHRVPLRFEVKAKTFCEVGFVLDDQHMAHALLRGSSSVTVVPRPSPSL